LKQGVARRFPIRLACRNTKLNAILNAIESCGVAALFRRPWNPVSFSALLIIVPQMLIAGLFTVNTNKQNQQAHNAATGWEQVHSSLTLPPLISTRQAWREGRSRLYPAEHASQPDHQWRVPEDYYRSSAYYLPKIGMLFE
jgi:hypothetical protein